MNHRVELGANRHDDIRKMIVRFQRLRRHFTMKAPSWKSSFKANYTVTTPHHGPAPDKLHMHLDIRPLDVQADPTTGYRVEPSGRVVLF